MRRESAAADLRLDPRRLGGESDRRSLKDRRPFCLRPRRRGDRRDLRRWLVEGRSDSGRLGCDRRASGRGRSAHAPRNCRQGRAHDGCRPRRLRARLAGLSRDADPRHAHGRRAPPQSLRRARRFQELSQALPRPRRRESHVPRRPARRPRRPRRSPGHRPPPRPQAPGHRRRRRRRQGPLPRRAPRPRRLQRPRPPPPQLRRPSCTKALSARRRLSQRRRRSRLSRPRRCE
mmetsp:Transcript_11165/g.33470  ORF Transcript_11165/g.33470 Transcript_11165/m.33470 type:complete len:232 (-) Transcript_11165:134-829(-)